MRNKILILICAIGVIGANSLVLSPIAGRVAAGLMVPVEIVLMGVAAYGIGTALSALFLAPLGDRFGADGVVRWSLVVWTMGMALSAGAASVTVLFMGQVLAGLAAGAALPSIYTLAAVIAPAGQDMRVMGQVLTGWTLSLVAGVSVSAVVADLLGWRGVYSGLAGFGGLLSLFAFRVQFGTVVTGRGTSPLTALHVAGIGRALLSAGLTMLAFYGFYTFAGVHITERLGHSATHAGGFALSYGIGFGLAAFVDPVVARLGRARAALLVFGCLALLYAGFAPLAPTYWAVIALALPWGICNHLALNLIVLRLTALDTAQRGAIMGLYSCITYVAVTAAAVVFAPIYTLAGWPACAIVASVLVVLMVCEILIRRRKTDQTRVLG